MSKKNSAKKVIGLVVSIVVVAVVAAVFNISRLTFLPEGLRASVSGFVDTYFSNTSAVISLKSVGAALLSLVVAFVVGYVVKFIINAIKLKNNRSQTLLQLFGKFLVYAIYIAGIVVALGCFGIDTTAILVGAGVIGIFIGFGAQSLVEDIITGLFIVLEGEFVIGDIITIDGFRGEVKSIGLRTVSIED
ncbi:MAG: mechanosensitive ion channel, partial [Clostridia bacterium]|nr:mechanosensitive ion channel [Clostridia bacterium]